MKSNRWSALSVFALFWLAVVLAPSRASAQAAGGRGGGGAGGLQQLRQALTQLDLSADQKKSVRDILQQAMQDARDAMQGLQDATPQERLSKMQDMQKTIADAREKIEDLLTPEQKDKYYPLMAKAALKQMTDLLAAIKTAAGKQDITDDLRKQLSDAIDDTQSKLDDDKSDAESVKDAGDLKDFSDKLQQTQMDFRKQVVDILGQTDAMKLMQSARQSIRPGGAMQGRGGNRASREIAPTTAPDAK